MLCFVEEKRAFSSTSTQILKSVCVPGHYLRYCPFSTFLMNVFFALKRSKLLFCVVGQSRVYHIVLSDLKKLATVKNKYNFIESKVHLIHSKHVPLIHYAVLIYALKELDWWPCFWYLLVLYVNLPVEPPNFSSK